MSQKLPISVSSEKPNLHTLFPGNEHSNMEYTH